MLNFYRGTKLDSGDGDKMAADDVDDVDESDTYDLAKAYFDLKEYDRSAFFSQDCKSSRCVFLHFFSRFRNFFFFKIWSSEILFCIKSLLLRF